MRRCYLVSYDITDAKRLRQVHRLLKAFGEAWQYSVFYCVLREIDRARLEVALNALIDARADQVLIADMGGSDDDARGRFTTLGAALPEPESGVVVI
ncbi:MAG: CRISPR-associated endonuclease Cas2 [Planctomycetota bacterium]|nr:CRISPR-associated endonuclease Cas2 [Planctomycetota bacterium]